MILTKSLRYLFILSITILSGQSCITKHNTIFTPINSEDSGINFSNIITTSDSLHLLNFHYLYNGGGVGIGDFNNDGLLDVFLGGNQVSSKLFINKSNFTFEDVTSQVGLTTSRWVNGISVIDINNDGLDDLYLSVGGQNCSNQCNNYLFINKLENGILKFEERAKDYGLDDGLYTQQAVFFDADGDEDLDVYLLHNYIDPNNKNYPRPKRYISHKSYDKLLIREEDDNMVIYKDKSIEMGINQPGYGLGIAISDLNKDGLLDIYVANDFITDDFLWINNGNGFDDLSKSILKHTSYNSMGVDISDINHDLLYDIYVTDMLPFSNGRQKTMLGKLNYDKYLLALNEGYNAQVVKNTLQINNGVDLSSNHLIQMSEIAYYARVHQTDWSWSALIADFTNNGKKELFVSNGYGANITDLDFINYNQEGTTFGNEIIKKDKIVEQFRNQKPVKLQNKMFVLDDELRFSEQSSLFFPNHHTLSNGAVYADLDNDGDLDLIVNNINENVGVYKNNSESNYIRIHLIGNNDNLSAIGAEVRIFQKENSYIEYNAPVRGYLSSTDPVCHFGLESDDSIDSMKIIWPDGQV